MDANYENESKLIKPPPYARERCGGLGGGDGKCLIPKEGAVW